MESVKILVFNPDNLPFGEMLRSVMKILSTAVSVIIGGLVQEAVSKINVPVPVLGDVLPIFLGSLVTGILSVTMLYFLDHSKTVQKVVEYANQLKDRFDQTVDYYAGGQPAPGPVCGWNWRVSITRAWKGKLGPLEN
ncbi:MAG: hypothetical protein ACOX48_07975 [Limnochordia bacterium]